MSLSKKFMMLDVNMKLENTVKRPAMPAMERRKRKRKFELIHSLNETSSSFFSSPSKWVSCSKRRSLLRLLTQYDDDYHHLSKPERSETTNKFPILLSQHQFQFLRKAVAVAAAAAPIIHTFGTRFAFRMSSQVTFTCVVTSSLLFGVRST